MNSHVSRPRRRTRILAGLITATALGLGMATSVSAQSKAAEISATFEPVAGVLTVRGRAADNVITVSRDATGNILVNDGAVAINGGTPTVANTTLVRVLGGPGNDQITILDNGNAPLPPAYVEGGAGNDTLIGGSGADDLDGGAGDDTLQGRDGDDLLKGGPGEDTIIGGRGADTMLGGVGSDQFPWNPGDGSDVIDGQGGVDTMLFNGSNANERIDLSASGGHVRFTRDVAAIVMDLTNVQQVMFQAFGGADTITVNDLGGTDLKGVTLNLAAVGGAGDGQADTVIVNGTDRDDMIAVSGSRTAGVTVSGLAAKVTIVGGEATGDQIVINGLAGTDSVETNGGAAADTFTVTANGTRVRVGRISPDPLEFDIAVESLTVHGNGGDDTITAGNGLAALTQLTLDGGPGNDILTGGDGADLLIGGPGNDTLTGGRGIDTVRGGAGDDTLVWNPGDGNDVVEGQAGHDTLLFNGSNANERIDVSADGRRVRFTRDVAAIVMDVDGVEEVTFTARGGSDTMTVHDLKGTDVRRVTLNLESLPGSGAGDGQADTVIVNGTTRKDAVTISGSGASYAVAGLTALVQVNGSEGANDRLVVNALAGDDIVDASALPAGIVRLTVDGGDGDDVLTGSAGDDTLIGGLGDDVLTGGPGNDTLDGGPGANIVIQ